MKTGFHKEHIIGILGLAMFSYGTWMALFVVPPMSHFQEVGRIFFIHVPTAWNSLLVLTGSFFLAIGVLINRKAGWDAALTASVWCLAALSCAMPCPIDPMPTMPIF